MVDPSLIRGILETTEPLNHKVMSGISTEQLREPERYIEKILRCASVDFPKEFTYDGYDVCSPEEEYKVVTRLRSNKSWYELARSDFYLVKFGFSFNGVELFPKYMYLPYIDNGMLYIRSKLYAVSPVLVDPAFSISGDSMFIQMTRARFNFERTSAHYTLDDSRETVYVAWSWMHFAAKKRFGRKSNNGRTMYTSLGHYVMAKYGFLTAMKMYAGASPIVGTDEITHHNYPPETYHIIKSIGITPRRLLLENDYKPTNIRMAIKKSEYNEAARVLIASFYYVTDNYPVNVTPEEVDDVRLWHMLLGYIIQPQDISEGLQIKEIRSHLESLDEYLDPLVQEDLSKANVPCGTIYDTFLYVMLTLASSNRGADRDINSPWGKRFTTTRYVLFDIVSDINRMLYALKNLSNKKEVIEERDVVNLLNEHMRIAEIAKLRYQNRHPEISLVDTSGECVFFDATSTMVTQDKASAGGGKQAKTRLDDPKKHLHGGLLFVNCYNNLPKSDPTGASKINPRVQLRSDGGIIYEETYKDMLADLQYRYMQ